ncbi:hypothetical protein [Stenotrophomonas sp.]|uniref:hypothetical protein n=1 Tax=Stenotrophomonas sp. TaxID=69392 RepID=UPI0028AFD53D|nr:hypothetical protein [Stenotrophomonas sp.]
MRLSASDREKASEREQLATDFAAFRKAGGKVQVLGNTPIYRKGISRRKVVEGGHDQRNAKKGASHG